MTKICLQYISHTNNKNILLWLYRIAAPMNDQQHGVKDMHVVQHCDLRLWEAAAELIHRHK